MVLYIGGSVCEVTFIRDLGTWPVVRRVFSLLGCLNSRTHRHSPYTTKVHCRTDRSAPRGHQCQPDSRTLNSIESVHQGTCAHAQVSNTVEHTLGFFDGCRGRGWGGVFGTNSFDTNSRTLFVGTRNAAFPETRHRAKRWPYPRGITQESDGRPTRTFTRLCFPVAQESATPRR